MFADGFSGLGLFDFGDVRKRGRVVGALIWGFPVFWALLTLFWSNPVEMVLIGGFVTAIILLLVVFAVGVFRLKRVPAALKPGKVYDVILLISVLAIVILAGTSIFRAINDYREKSAAKEAESALIAPDLKISSALPRVHRPN